MIKVFTSIESVKKEWGRIKLSDFLDIHFLEIYYDFHSQIKHLFIVDSNMRLYAHIFKLKFNKTKNYLNNNSLINIVLSAINFNVLYLTNSFITNLPAFVSDKKINLNQLLNAIQDNYSLIVIPEFLFKKMQVEDNNYAKIEVEEEMVLDIQNKWNTLEDYMLDLRKKYRNKLKNIIKKTRVLEVRVLDLESLNDYNIQMQDLILQVVNSSRFKGPAFNIDSLKKAKIYK